jgi:hypothetical protein
MDSRFQALNRRFGVKMAGIADDRKIRVFTQSIRKTVKHRNPIGNAELAIETIGSPND